MECKDRRALLVRQEEQVRRVWPDLPVNKASPDCRVRLATRVQLGPLEQLACLEQAAKPDSLDLRDRRVYQELVVRLERPEVVELWVQPELLASLEPLGLLVPRVLRDHQDHRVRLVLQAIRALAEFRVLQDLLACLDRVVLQVHLEQQASQDLKVRQA